MSSQKIILIGPTAPKFKGGIVHYTYNLYQQLVKQGFNTKLVSFSRGYPSIFFPGSQTQDSSKKQFLIKQEKAILDWLNPFSWFKTAQWIEKLEPELVICQWWTWFWTFPFFLIFVHLKWFTDIKIVMLVHNPQDHEQAGYKKWLTKLVLKQVDKIVAHSKDLVIRLRHQFPDKQVVLAFHPLYSFFVSKKRLSQLQAQEKLEVRSPLLLFFGHIRYYKGLDVLLKALAKANKKLKPKIQLMIAGEFWEEPQTYLELIKKLNLQKQIHLVNHYISNEQVGLYFIATDAVVIPYRGTTGAGPAKIALAFDKPIIATNTGDNQDLFAQAKIGELVEPDDVEDLSKGIINFFSKPTKRYQQAIEEVKTQLTWEQLVEKIVK